MVQATSNTQSINLSRAFGSTSDSLSADLAKFLLANALDPIDELRANELAEKARSETLSLDEETEIDK